MGMRASAAVLAFFAGLGGAMATWMLRLPGDDAQMVAAGLAALCISAAAASLLRRRLTAGVAVLTAAVALWAATGPVGLYLEPRAVFVVGALLVVALLALIFANAPSRAAGGARRP
jgi:hypothetical protein